MKRKSFPRHDRELMVVQWFAIRVQNGNLEPATMPAIARGIGLEPSSHFARILNHMAEDRKLERTEIQKPGRWKGYQYMLFPGTYHAPQPRQISLKIRGRDAGQLELFTW